MSSKTEFQIASESAMKKIQLGKEKLSTDEVTALAVRFPFYIQCVLGTGDPDLPNNEEELQQKEEIAERMIQEIEAGVQALRERIEQADIALSPRVLSPFNRIERNIRNNPLRNKYACRMAALHGRLSQYPISENAFFYMLAGGQRQQNAASFRETDRTVFCREDFSRESQIDALVACHEIVHVTQDDVTRGAISSVAQAHEFHNRLKFLSQGKRVVINGEASPYTTELQIADLALGGALQKPDTISEDHFLERLGATRPDQACIGATLLRLAKSFPGFEKHQLNQPYPDSFVSELISMYRAEGYEILYQTPSGQLTRMNGI